MNDTTRNDEMRDDYDFSGGVRGKHHEAYREGTNLVWSCPETWSGGTRRKAGRDTRKRAPIFSRHLSHGATLVITAKSIHFHHGSRMPYTATPSGAVPPQAGALRSA